MLGLRRGSCYSFILSKVPVTGHLEVIWILWGGRNLKASNIIGKDIDGIITLHHWAIQNIIGQLKCANGVEFLQ
jgi:hypothetical protein